MRARFDVNGHVRITGRISWFVVEPSAGPLQRTKYNLSGTEGLATVKASL